MKTILVDAVNTFIIKNKWISDKMYNMLEKYPNKKIILTNANDEEIRKFWMEKLPYELFTLKHNPNKEDPNYYKIMLKYFNLKADNVIYFEHNKKAVESALSVWITTFLYDKDSKNLDELKTFIDKNL